MIKTQLSHAKYQPLVDDIDIYFAKSDIVLQDGRNMIKLIEFEKEILVVKSFAIPNAFNRFIYTYLRKSKAWRSYEYGLKIAKFTPKVVARVEHYQPLLGKSYFICEKFYYDFDIRAPLLDDNFIEREMIFKQFAKFVYQLHQQNIIHQDLSPGNILIKKNELAYEFKIIDINRMIFKTLSVKEQAKNFNKLWANDSDLTLILAEYAQLAKLEEKSFIDLGLKYTQQDKQAKTRKKKIKQLLGL